MYTQEDFAAIDRQYKRRLLWCLIPVSILLIGLIFAFLLIGQPEGVGLLIAAKSILRFGAVKDDRAMSEYVIIGTLASFGWAMLTGYGTVGLCCTNSVRGFIL